MEGISLRELIRMHEDLKEDHDKLTEYAHEQGHKLINHETVIPIMRRDIDIHYKQLDSLRKFMWIMIGAMGVINIVIPVLDKLGRFLK